MSAAGVVGGLAWGLEVAGAVVAVVGWSEAVTTAGAAVEPEPVAGVLGVVAGVEVVVVEPVLPTPGPGAASRPGSAPRPVPPAPGPPAVAGHPGRGGAGPEGGVGAPGVARPRSREAAHARTAVAVTAATVVPAVAMALPLWVKWWARGPHTGAWAPSRYRPAVPAPISAGRTPALMARWVSDFSAYVAATLRTRRGGRRRRTAPVGTDCRARRGAAGSWWPGTPPEIAPGGVAHDDVEEGGAQRHPGPLQGLGDGVGGLPDVRGDLRRLLAVDLGVPQHRLVADRQGLEGPAHCWASCSAVVGSSNSVVGSVAEDRAVVWASRRRTRAAWLRMAVAR